ncbi:MAG: hypothetical protein NUV65_03595 [Candidatus Roizmanbacteria bacterium]|nr:hypothetical protein [Candidatus Roizmanbacteria bacterium]
MAGIKERDYEGMVKEQRIGESTSTLRDSISGLDRVTSNLYDRIFGTDRVEEAQGNVPQADDVIMDVINVIDRLTAKLNEVANSLERL